MLKTAGVVMIIAACSGLGFRQALLYNRRIKECEQISRAVQFLLGEIRFHHLPLEEAMGRAGMVEKGAFAAFLKRLAGRLSGRDGGRFYELWQEELAGYLKESLLGGEAELLYYLGQQLGQFDLEAQLENLSRFLEQWRMQTEELKRQEEKEGRLYRYLGVFAGFFLAILLM